MATSFVPSDSDELIVSTTTTAIMDRFLVTGDAPPRSWSSFYAPPFVSEAVFERYHRMAPRTPGLSFTVQWFLHSYPGRGPRRWLQKVVDGREERCWSDTGPVDLSVEVSYSAFCRFIVGAAAMREMPGSATVSGSLGALSSLHWIVEQPRWLRSSQVWGQSREAALHAVLDFS